MSDYAKILQSGSHQTVKLPKEYRFEGQERVRIYRQGQRVILESEEPVWSQDFLRLAGSAEDFPHADEPPQAEPGPDLDE